MEDLKLEYLSASEIGRMVNSKAIAPTAVLEYFEKRIKERNPSINAFVYTRFDEAYERAKELEERLQRGEDCGPFAGVPFALKDFLPSKKGWTHSRGGVDCLVREDGVSSTFCEAMEKAGGIAVGKTNSPAYGFRGVTEARREAPPGQSRTDSFRSPREATREGRSESPPHAAISSASPQESGQYRW